MDQAGFELVKIPDYDKTVNLVLFIIICLIISIPVRVVLRLLRLRSLQEFVLAVTAICFGLMLQRISYFAEVKAIVKNVNLRVIFHAYLPIHLTATIYRMEQYLFMRSIAQVVVIVLFGATFTTTCLSIILYYLHRDNVFIESVIAAAMIIPIQPLRAVLMFKDVFKYSFLRILLDGESVMMNIPIMVIYEVFLGYYIGAVTTWSQLLFVVLRKLVIGFILGVFVGVITVRILRWLYNEPCNALILTLGMNYFLYTFSENLIGCSASLAVVILNCFVASERHRLTDEVNRNLVYFWSVLLYMADIANLMLCCTCLTIGILDAMHKSLFHISLWVYVLGIVLRILRFFILHPILNLMHYELHWRCLLVLGFSDIKGCINLNLLLMVMHQTRNIDFIAKFSIEIFLCTMLSMFINVPLMKLIMRFIGFTEVSIERKMHMNNCMRFIMSKRMTLMNILKMNRLYSLSNWHTVRKETHLHPSYPQLAETQFRQMNLIREDIIWVDGKRCPRCVVDLPVETGQDTLQSLTRECEQIILKTKRISVIKQYENGMINKYCLVKLVHYFETLLESTREDTELNIRMAYLEKHKVLTWIRRLLVKFYKHSPHTVSKTQCANFLYFMTMHVAYEFTIVVVIITYAIVSACVHKDSSNNAKHIMYLIHVFVTILFLTDFFLKLISFSNVWLCISGILPYFRSKRNMFDFFFLTCMLINLQFATGDNIYVWIYSYVMPSPRILALLRCVLIPHILSFLSVNIIACIDHRVDEALCFDYILATALINAADDVLEALPHMIQLKMLRDYYRKQIEEERNRLTQKMDAIRRDRPWISISVKTNQVICSTITALKNTLDDYKTSGFVDNIEHSFIYQQIFEKQKMFRSLSLLQETAPKMIFTEVLWMLGEAESVVQYLFQNLQIVTWSTNDIVQRSNNHATGIYIIINGRLLLKYRPETLPPNTHGRIPIVDYLNTVDYSRNITDQLSTGHTFGELAVLTGRKYDSLIYTLSPCTAYWIPAAIIKEAMKLSSHHSSGLEARMWKCSVIHLASAIMLEYPLYKNFSNQEIRLKLERAFVPRLCGYKLFAITEKMDDVILLEGVVEDIAKGEWYTAPQLMPRHVRYLSWRTTLIARSNGKGDIPFPRLLIVPMVGVNEVEIMESEEDIGELMSTISSDCIQERKSKRKNARRQPVYHYYFPLLNRPSESFNNFDWDRKVEITQLEGDDPKLHFNFSEEGDCLHSHLTRNRTISISDESIK